MIRLWLRGLWHRQPAQLLGVIVCIGAAVALMASIGAFLAHARTSMTSRAIASVAVDWQVDVARGADAARIRSLVAASPGTRSSDIVGFTSVPGLSATSGSTGQTTGAGVLLGLPAGYAQTFPGQIRVLSGSATGALLAQQTAANLHAGPGSTISITRPGLAPARITVAGVVDLPQANSLFQVVGAPTASQPPAPPDNVVLLPFDQWRAVSDPLTSARPDLVHTQIHARVDHGLPQDPAAAYSLATARAHNVEARAAGAAKVGDNLSAALDAARSDAAYAQVLFGFLGLPGIVLAGLLTATVAAAGTQRRRAEQALLRVRGASQRDLLRLVGAEALAVAASGCVVGFGIAALVSRFSYGTATFGTSLLTATVWCALAALIAVVIAVGAVLLPAVRDLRARTIAFSRQPVSSRSYPWWARYGIDVLALVGAGVLVYAAGRNGYQLVLAPEGVPTISVSYWTLLGPALLWLGAALLSWRLVDLLVGRGRRVIAWALRPLAGRASGSLANSLARQRTTIVRAAVLLTLALAFAISTATFNSTYRAQAEADAQLTNGADVVVTESPGSSVRPALADRLASLPGVRHVEAMQHRYAYVGSDLQDLFGVDPARIRSATALQDRYFTSGGTAAQLMHTLAVRPDSILVSAETVKDYQLSIGDRLNLRLVDGRTHRQVTTPFRLAGVVAEFPTAPKDSFFVANASYIARATGSATVGAFLVDTGGSNVRQVAASVRSVVGPTAAVTDITTVRGKVGSSLTSVDLRGLTQIELAFAVALAVASGGVVLGLGLAARRRSLAIMRVLGARPQHLRASVLGETAAASVSGIALGAGLGAVLTSTLVAVLTGVFDPPPNHATVPWSYLALVVGLVLVCLGGVTALVLRTTRRDLLTSIRRL